MRRLFSPVLLLFYSVLSFAQSIPDKVPGQALIKIKPAYNQGMTFATSGSGSVTSSNTTVNEVFSALNVTKTEKLFGSETDVATVSAFGLDQWYVVYYPTTTPVETALATLRNNTSIEIAEPNGIRFTNGEPNDPKYLSGNQWGLKKIGMTEAWEITGGNFSSKVAVLDVGFKLGHPDLATSYDLPQYRRDETDINFGEATYINYAQISGEDYTTPDNDPTSVGPHGTHVAGIIAANTNNNLGVAGIIWDGTNSIVPVRCGAEMIGPMGQVGAIESDDWIRALNWVRKQNNIKVVNMSFGGIRSIQGEQDAINAAVQSGITIIVSSGNENASSLSYPAAYQGVIAVGASNYNDERCDTDDWGYFGDSPNGSNYGPGLSLVAPGNNILSTYFGSNDYESLSGTSMAAPHVAGAVALIRAIKPTLTPSQIKLILETSADKVGGMNGQNFTNEYGYGRLNVFKALQLANQAKITVTQRKDEFLSGDVGVVLRWNGAEFTGNVRSIPYFAPLYSTETLKGDQSIYDDQKYREWYNAEVIEPTVTNHHSFSVPGDLNLRSQFYETVNAALKVKVDGIDYPTGFVKFKDPWLVDFPDPVFGDTPRNRGMNEAPLKPVLSGDPNPGVYNLGTGTDYKGVFKNLDPSLDDQTYYKIQSNSTETFGTQAAYFLNWSAIGAFIPNMNTSTEQLVKFTADNAVVTGNFKGKLLTGTPELGDQINQRRLISDGSSHLLVYESMGEIWVTGYNGTSWSIEKRLSFGTGAAKNPSISNLFILSSTDKKAVITWIENGLLYFQPIKVGTNWTDIKLTWNTTPQREYSSLPSGAPRTDSRPVSTLFSTNGTEIRVWYAYEKTSSGISSGYYRITNENGSSFLSGTYLNLAGSPGVTIISNSIGDQYPVLINQPAAVGNPEKKAIYFLASGYASGKRIAEYALSSLTTSVLPATSNEYTFYGLSGGVNPTSSSYALVAAAQRNLSGGVISYDAEVYSKASYSGTGLPTLSKIYTNATKPVVMLQNASNYGSPIYEVNFKQGTSWYKADGGASITQIGSNLGGIFAREQVGVNDRKSIFVKTTTSPASLVVYSGSGVLNKGEGTLYADVRSVRNYVTLSGQSKRAILDFAGALVEPVDSLENGSSICAVKLIAPDQNTIIVRQPDSIKTALAIDLIRNGVSVRSYSASLWDELSINSFEDVQDGDVLVFRLGFPVASSWGYEIYDFNGTSLTKNEEETADAVPLKKLENGVSVYPNPFNPNTSISVSLEAPASVKVMVFNILGQLVSDFGKADLGAGVHTYAFDGKTLASGTYFYRVEIGEKVKTGKLQLLK